MKGSAAVTLSNENDLSRFRPSAHVQPPADAARAAYGPQPGCSARPVPCRPTVRRADAQRGHPGEPAVFGLRDDRVEFIRCRNDHSPKREE